MNQELYSEQIDVGISSTADFNLIGHLEGTDKVNLRYIRDKAHVEISIQSGSIADNGKGNIKILLVASNQEDLNIAKDLCQNLIATVKAQKLKAEQTSSTKKTKKRKNNQKFVDLPVPLLLAMKYYFPGEPVQPPPPGSTRDIKEHNSKFRNVGKKMNWFSKQ